MSTAGVKMMFGVSLFGAVTAVSVSDAWGGNNRVRLRDVCVVTFYEGKMTTGRRFSPVPQLTCVGGNAAGVFIPEVVQCYNKGFNDYDVQWQCMTDMDSRYRFGRIEVFCEGYEYPDDPFILKGSCGLQYTLELTENDRQKRNEGYSGDHPSNNHSHNDQNNNSGAQRRIG